MQLRETKLTPLADGKTLVELVYADHADEAQATTRLRFQVIQEPRTRTSLAAIQRSALLELDEWMRVETNRLHEELSRG